MRKINLMFFITIGLFICFPVRGQQIKSVYTDLTAKKCQTIELNENEAGSYRGKCKGVAGYQIESLEGDLRQSINVIAPDQKKFELNLWTVVSGAFSHVGEKAEWRVIERNRKVLPIALIVRFNASENPEDSSKTTSYLVVSKITKNDVCVTDIVKPQPNANAAAVNLADAAASKPCLNPQN